MGCEKMLSVAIVKKDSEVTNDVFLIDELKKRPHDFRVLERVPFTRDDVTFPLQLDCAVGDEQFIVVADVETTGFDVATEGVTQLGLTKLAYSPSLGRITSVVASQSWFNDPGKPIPEFITQLTGITDEDVKGKVITQEDIEPFLSGDPIVIAHNAGFDRPFCENKLPFPANLRWGCSANEIDFVAAGLESKKLEFLIYRINGFYEGHRADIDTLAVAWLLYQRPELLQELMGNIEKDLVVIRAYDLPFDRKDEVKSLGFKWDDGSGSYRKHWHYKTSEDKLPEVMAILDSIYPAGKNAAHVERVSARARFK